MRIKIKVITLSLLLICGSANFNSFASSESEAVRHFKLLMTNKSNDSLENQKINLEHIKVLNQLSHEYTTVNKMHEFYSDFYDETYGDQNFSFVANSMKDLLDILKAKGYGSGRLQNWRSKRFQRYSDRSPYCDASVFKEKATVFIVDVVHGGKTISFGFYALTTGRGVAFPENIKQKILPEYCA